MVFVETPTVFRKLRFSKFEFPKLFELDMPRLLARRDARCVLRAGD